MLLTTNTSHFFYFLTPSPCPTPSLTPPPPLTPLNSPLGECTWSLFHPIISLQVTPTTQSNPQGPFCSSIPFQGHTSDAAPPTSILFLWGDWIPFRSVFQADCFPLENRSPLLFFCFLSVLSPFFRFLRKESGDSQMLPDRTDEATKLCFRPEERKDRDCFVHICFPSLLFHARKS